MHVYIFGEVAHLFLYLLAIVVSSVNYCSDSLLIFRMGFH